MEFSTGKILNSIDEKKLLLSVDQFSPYRFNWILIVQEYSYSCKGSRISGHLPSKSWYTWKSIDNCGGEGLQELGKEPKSGMAEIRHLSGTNDLFQNSQIDYCKRKAPEVLETMYLC